MIEKKKETYVYKYFMIGIFNEQKIQICPTKKVWC